jgi:hypothetical protein
MPEKTPMTFRLVQNTETVADGVRFDDGTVCLNWRGHRNPLVYGDIDDVTDLVLNDNRGLVLMWDLMTFRDDDPTIPGLSGASG